MNYIQIYLISTTKETDLRLLFCFHLKLCLTGKCLQSLLFESIKISPPGKTLPCVNSKLVPHADKEKSLNMENKLALSILGDLDQID